MMEGAMNTRKETFEHRSKEALGGSMAEGISGIAAVALAIIGLAHVFPLLMASIATIALGAALAFEGGAISARYAALIEESRSKPEEVARWGGITALFIAGAAGIALGILSLVGLDPMILIPAAAIVFGSALLLDSGANTRLSVLEAQHSEEFMASERMIRETARSSAGVQVLVGVASIALGILALCGVNPLALSLVAVLVIASANLIAGSMISSRFAFILRG
jgi:hypothetical protein